VIRDALESDLSAIVRIYNAAIPGRLASADTESVTVGARQPWFIEHSPGQYPLWVFEQDRQVLAWLSLSPFYGRPAYSKTAEVSVYVSPEFHRRGLGTALLQEAIRRGPSIGKGVFLAFIFGHNAPSIRLFQKVGFAQWGKLPQVAVLDDVKRDLVILGLHLLQSGGRH
jgi:phosphinothricin acetyltransferase